MVKWRMDSGDERFAVNWFGQFKNRNVESDFVEHSRAANQSTIRTLLLIFGGIFAVFAFYDFHFYRDNASLHAVLVLRVLGLVIAICTAVMVYRFKKHKDALTMISLAQISIFAIYLFIINLLHGEQIDMQFLTVIVFILAAFLIPNVWKNSVAAGCIILTGFIIFRTAISPEDVWILLVRLIYVCICFIGCAIFIFGKERAQRKQYVAEKVLEYMSITDKLTGINNRMHFEQVLGAWIKNKRHTPLSLLLIDVDNFKKVNDCFGHAAGDRVLVGVAKAVCANIRDEDVFARWGGEEFVLLFGETGIQKAAELAERLREEVEESPFGEAGKVTISIGAAEYRNEESITDFVNRADEKMYEAKRSGKNQTKF
ncbi:MAG: GGDEF domain-containing protein [Treponema sp.]|jgi:diguanylate cyclase (GGDEF)-like protein|nr:GGDEF domain-containing protein [Treponema sp.]